MGTAESSQSSELGGTDGQSSFHRQSPNVARLIRSEHSSKMEYEFPISDGSGSASHQHHHHHHHHHGGSSSSNHTMTQHGSSGNRHDQYSSSSNQQHLSQQSSVILPTNYGNLSTSTDSYQSKMNSNTNSRLWYSLTSCFGCRTRHSHSSSMNPLRDKVHAIRIVRASNDLTPAVFDSHYNIITLEQLRECDNNNSGSGVGMSSNDACDSSSSPNAGAAQNGNGSVASSKTDSDHRMKKKKKKRAAAAAAAAVSAAAAAHTAKTMGSDDEDGSRRT